MGFSTSAGELKKVALNGGVPTTLSSGRDLRGATWGPNDTIVFAELWSPLRRISASGGAAEALATNAPKMNVRWPSFLPNGDKVLYTVSDFSGDYENASLAVLSLKSAKSQIVLKGATYGRYVPTGHLTYLHSNTIFAVPFDLSSLKVTGPAAPLVSGVDSYFGSGLAQFAVSSDGSLFFLPRNSGDADGELVSVDRNGEATPLSSVKRPFDEPRLSSDGHHVLVTIGSGSPSDLWLYDIDRDMWTRLTTQATNRSAIWSPDGKQIAFASNRNGRFNLFVMPSDGSVPPEELATDESWLFPDSWSPDGRVIAVTKSNRATLRDILLVSVGQKQSPKLYLSTAFNEDGGVFSHDGRWIAYESDESGRSEIYVQRYPDRSRKWLVSTNGGTQPTWRRDGRELFYRSVNRMMAVDVHLSAEFTTGKPRLLFRGEFQDAYDVTADGQHFIMVRRGHPSSRAQIHVVLGAFETIVRGGKGSVSAAAK